MADVEKKGLTVKIDADLHAEVRQYLEAHEMTMAEFVSMALQDEGDLTQFEVQQGTDHRGYERHIVRASETDDE